MNILSYLSGFMANKPKFGKKTNILIINAWNHKENSCVNEFKFEKKEHNQIFAFLSFQIWYSNEVF